MVRSKTLWLWMLNVQDLVINSAVVDLLNG